MVNPARRDFLKYTIGATLASALPVKAAQIRRDSTLWPLVVDLIGPMAFKKGSGVIDVWMPKLDGEGKKHEAGMGTSVTSVVLAKNDYVITGPTPYGGDPTIYGTSHCTVYPASPNDYSAKNRFIRLTLPMPNSIAALDPVSARMYPTGSSASGSYTLYAVGLRFLYDKAGTPTMNPGGVIPFDPAPGETQLSISIGYAPYDYNDTGHAEAKYAFNELSKLFPNLDLQVDFEFAMMGAAQRKPGKSTIEWRHFGGPLHNCKAPIMLLS
jgi:hypothetical protein